MTGARYVARLTVHRVDADEPARGTTPAKRSEPVELAGLTIRAGSLDALRSKVQAHVALLEEDDA